jgi:hypothetical protein
MATGDQTKLFELLGKTDTYTDQEIADLRRVSPMIANSGTDYRDVASFRASIELIDSIRRFDEASSKIVNRGNRINAFVLVFAILAAILGGGALWVSWLSYSLALSK